MENPEPAEGETLDCLAGSWKIFQLRRGHRYATDDLLAAYTACCARPDARRLLDLGAGVGSVGLLALQALLHRSQKAHLISVELQEESVALLRKTVTFNGLLGRVEIREGDLRDPAVLEGVPPCDLVLSNPPYLPPRQAVPSPVPQRATARLELHGDVFDFCRAAARHLAPAGRFCFCHAAFDPRPLRAMDAAGLALLARREVVFREGRPPRISLFTCGFEGARRDPPPLTIRGSDGDRTGAFRAIRRAMWIEA